MKGYKGMTADMTCRGMKYEIGKTYHEDNITLCERGLHFCKNLCDVFSFYSREDGNRFFEVEATGNVYQGDNKCVASDLTVIRELTNIEVNRNYYDYGNGNGYDNGNGDGNGDDNGNGYGYGNGNGNGYGYNILKILIFKEV